MPTEDTTRLLGWLNVRGTDESKLVEFIGFHWLVDQYRNDNDSQLKVNPYSQTASKKPD